MITILFCEFKKFINSFIKFFFWTDVTRFCHVGISLVRKLFIPVGLSCCLVVFMGYNIKTSFAEEGDKTSEIRNSKLNVGNGLQDLIINSVCGKVQFNGRIDTLEFGANKILEIYTSFCSTVFSAAEASEIKTDGGKDQGSGNWYNVTINYWNNVTADDFNQMIHDFVRGMLYGLIPIFIMFMCRFTQRRNNRWL